MNDIDDFISLNNLEFAVFDFKEKIIKYFPDSNISLKLVDDIEEDYKTLFLIINTEIEISLALNKLRSFIKDWQPYKNPDINRFISISII
jgi:hypothetical protein